MIRGLVLAFAFSLCQLPAWAQQCSGPLRLVVGLSPGGGMDAVARMLAQGITEKFNRAVIVENKVGAGGNLAAEFVAKSPHDGCTIIIRGNEHNMSPLVYARAGYESKDFAPIVRAVAGPAVIVAAANQPFKSLIGMIDYAKANPGRLSYGSGGVGTANHVFAEMLVRSARIDVVHIPYKGAAPAMSDTVGGIVPLSVGSVAAAQSFIDAGKLIPLAVTGPQRWPTLPDVPTLTEAGYADATMVYWMGFLAPAGTPANVIDKLNQEFRAVLDLTPVKSTLLAMGYRAEGGSSQDFDRFLQSDERISRKLSAELKLKAD